MKMSEEEFEEFFAELARDLKKPTNRPRRRQPKHKGGLVSSRQRVALGQESNPVKAIYEMDRNPTPIRENGVGLTREVGPGNEYNKPWSQQKLGRGDSGHA